MIFCKENHNITKAKDYNALLEAKFGHLGNASTETVGWAGKPHYT